MIPSDDYRRYIEQARSANLVAVIEALGGQRDRYDRHKYRLPGSIISITNDMYYDHWQERGGRGAINLVMHVEHWDFKEAVQYLLHSDLWLAQSHTTSTDTHHNADYRAAAPADHPPFVPPTPDAQHWPQVHRYLINRRGIPAQILDELHGSGLIYADTYSNAVFLRHDEEGRITGAALRSIHPGSSFKGLARGTHRDAGYFSYQTGQRDAYSTPSLIIIESAIDAMSLHGLHLRQGQQTPTRYLSTDGAGSLPFPVIDTVLQHGWTVQAAFDNDRAGDHLWQQIRDHYPTETDPSEPHHVIWREVPPHGKDWNDSLLWVQSHSSFSQTRINRHDHSR